jgi:Mg2+/Co2+ transporter CorB
MNHLPVWAQIALLILLLLCSAFFSISETAMMAQNRSRLKFNAKQGSGSAKLTQRLLERVDRLLSTILIGNNLLNTAITTLVTAVAINSFGNDDKVLTIATLLVGTLIIVFAEILPKVVGASYADRIARIVAYPLAGFQILLAPLVFFVNGFVNRILSVLGIQTISDDTQRLTPQELRQVVLESQNYIPAKPRTILLNLLNLEDLRVDEVMTPRSHMEVLDLLRGDEGVQEQLATCYHNKLPAVEADVSKVIGMLHVRRALAASFQGPLSVQAVRDLVEAPVFVPSGTAVLQQLQQFQDTGTRVGLVVDEYGEVLGLVTLEDILEEIVGEYTTASPRAQPGVGGIAKLDADGTLIVDASTPIRLLNRHLKLGLPEDGPITLNGLMIEWLEDLPEAEVALRIGDVVLETLQVEAHSIKTVRIRRLRAR